MAEPKKRYDVGGKTYTREDDGSFKLVQQAQSIEDAPKPIYKSAPAMPVKGPAHDHIMAQRAPGNDRWGEPGPLVPGPEDNKRNLMAAGSMGAAMMGGPAAGLVGMVARSAGGTMLGNAAGQLMEGQDKDFSLSEMFQEGIVDGAVNTLLGGAGAVVGKIAPTVGRVVRNVKKRGISSGHPNKKGIKSAIEAALLDSRVFSERDQAGNVLDMLGKETRQAINADRSVPMSVGMVTGQTMPEQVFKSQKAKLVSREASIANLKTLDPFLPEGTQAQAGIKAVKRTEGLKDALRARENTAYDAVKDIATNFKKDVVTGTTVKTTPAVISPRNGVIMKPAKSTNVSKRETIEGPINVGEVRDFAQHSLGDLRKTLELTKDSAALSGKLKSLETTLASFETTDVIPYQTARDVQANVNMILRDTDRRMLPNRTTHMLSELKGKLDNDVLASMEMNWPKGSAEAYKNAMQTTRRRTRVITPDIADAVDNSAIAPENFFNNAFDTATQARRYAVASGKETTAKEFMRQFKDRFSDNMTGGFDGAKALTAWGKDTNSEVASVLLNKEQRHSIEYFLRRQAAVSKDPSNIGVMSVDAREANASVGSVKDLASAIGNPARLFGHSVITLTAIIKGRDFAEKVLLNPVKARTVSKLIGMGRTRPGATSEARNFILAGGLGEVLLRADNGEEVLYDTDTGDATKVK